MFYFRAARKNKTQKEALREKRAGLAEPCIHQVPLLLHAEGDQTSGQQNQRRMRSGKIFKIINTIRQGNQLSIELFYF